MNQFWTSDVENSQLCSVYITPTIGVYEIFFYFTLFGLSLSSLIPTAHFSPLSLYQLALVYSRKCTLR